MARAGEYFLQNGCVSKYDTIDGPDRIPIVTVHEFELEQGTVIQHIPPAEYRGQNLLTLPKTKKKVTKEGWCKPSDIWWSDQPGAVEDMVKVTYEVEK